MKNTSAIDKQNAIDFPIKKIRKDFPILSSYVHDKPLVYLDNAATTQKPIIVTEAIKKGPPYRKFQRASRRALS